MIVVIVIMYVNIPNKAFFSSRRSIQRTTHYRHFFIFNPFLKKIHKYIFEVRFQNLDPYLGAIVAGAEPTRLGAIVAGAELLGSTQTWR